jgi:hypothetical protein
MIGHGFITYVGFFVVAGLGCCGATSGAVELGQSEEMA